MRWFRELHQGDSGGYWEGHSAAYRLALGGRMCAAFGARRSMPRFASLTDDIARSHVAAHYVFHQLSKLKRISLHENNLVGTMPRSFYNLSSLEEVFLNNNIRLTGRLPINIGLMQPHLYLLSLSDNHFTGSIPPSLLNSLGVLDVARNNFSGKLVITSRKICKLTTVSLSSTNFGSGEDDDELMKFIDGLSICKNLGLLDLSYNRMRGFLPDSLGNLSASLYHLSVSSNLIQGSLPPSICSLINLTHLGMSDNIFSGIIPNCLGNISRLSFLDVNPT
ncbi:leucine-rich repeat protein [Artemisia annua]|uniref:Leucine-rich repeat protein n=1 Tax=Artemisia annua TaxID=35608 RepID=A0A2U1KZT0_ARTAN|nr:leucine-rich repeat protein [Artemisia annua]